MRIGIDLGGTKIEGIALTDGGEIAERRRVATPRDYAGSVEAVGDLVDTIERAVATRCSVGVGIPGALTPEGLVKNANSTWLIGNPLGRDLEVRLSRPVRLMNDANCFAISEAADGAGAGADVVFGVILGTGVGGGIVVRGQCFDRRKQHRRRVGPQSPALDVAGRVPRLGVLLWETRLHRNVSFRPGVRAGFRRPDGRGNDEPGYRRRRSPGGLGARVRRSRRYHDRLARALASLINVLDPDVVVLGGGMSNLPLLADSVSALLPRYVFSNSVRTRVVPNVHGDASAGASGRLVVAALAGTACRSDGEPCVILRSGSDEGSLSLEAVQLPWRESDPSSLRSWMTRRGRSLSLAQSRHPPVSCRTFSTIFVSSAPVDAHWRGVVYGPVGSRPSATTASPRRVPLLPGIGVT